MINGVFTEAPLPPSATPRSEPAPGRRDIATQCDLLGIEAPRSRAPGAPIPLDQLRAQAQEAEQKAKACGVEMAKRAFVAKVLTLVAASAVLITAALITGLTAGAGVPLLTLASVGFTLAVGDVACAAYDWNHKKNGGGGLAMGSDAIGNAIHWLGKTGGASDERARQVAAYGSLLARSAVTVSTVAVSGFLPVAAPLALQTTIPALTLGRTMIEISANAIKTNETHHGIVQRVHEISAGRAWGRVEIAQSEQRADRDADERRISAQLATLEKTRAFLLQTLSQSGAGSAPPTRRYSFA
ncbi:Protein EseG [Edwardsiella anguillarum]|uniref:Two-component sensor/regulator n=3 Tax=Hafniaceae TaxID=1903412 RepID=A0A076LMQ4_9GAMM|nr:MULTISPECIES: protein EseG [Edwardsiella]AKM48570.1 protein EseG [Edwardsiella sp. EA181011]GAJ67840.1 protein EseG [Edwardsiella piscicida]AIJ09181.1 two-component sensor/regulator [Edwardsiella anguillarum ET080813]KAB0589970.1 protein EseG [Edwardsiella anguillarum]UBU94883.1 protein EseG [Edwardsiella sp. LADL05-105]